MSAGTLKFADVAVGDQLDPISIPVTLQRLVMEAGANRDFSLIHHDRDVARATGAPDAYMNTFFIAGMFERLLRESMIARIAPVSEQMVLSFLSENVLDLPKSY